MLFRILMLEYKQQESVESFRSAVREELAEPRTRLTVPVVHDVDGGLVPPVEHQNHQNVPQLVTGTEVVQLPWNKQANIHTVLGDTLVVLLTETQHNIVHH